MENPETPKRHGWPIIRKAQVSGAAMGALLTILLLGCLWLRFQGGYGYAIFLWVVSLPSVPLFYFLKKPIPNLIANSGTALCILIICNTFSYFVVGTLIGWPIRQFKN
jgi:hypothetical protein